MGITNNFFSDVIGSVFHHLQWSGEGEISRVKVIKSIQSNEIESKNKTWLSWINDWN